MADKGLPAIYGVVFMLIVIRRLPPEEYGTFLLFQTVYLLISALASSFAIQPMVKYVAEGFDARLNSSATLILTTLFIGACTGLVLILSSPIARVLDAAHFQRLEDLFLFLPVLFVPTIYKLIATGILQARMCMKQLFAVDTTYYLSSLILIIIAAATNVLVSAQIVVFITILSTLLASGVAFLVSRHIAIPTWRWDKVEAGRILSYGKYSLGGTIGNVVQTQFDTFLISMFSGVGGVAVYGAAKNFTRVFDMFSQSIQMLMIPATSMLEARNDKRGMVVLVEKALCFASYAILPAIIVYVLFPGWVVWLIYGDKYAESAAVLRVLALMGFIVPWGAVIASVLFGTGKTAIGFAISLVSLVLSLGIYSAAGSIGGLMGIVWGVVIVNAILVIIGIVILRRLVPFQLRAVIFRLSDIIEFVRTWKWPAKSPAQM